MSIGPPPPQSPGNACRAGFPGYILFLVVWLAFFPCSSLGATTELTGVAAQPVWSDNPMRTPELVVIEEARALVAGMIRSSRGPYRRIRWFCEDGSVLPPRPYACRELGGGRQHAEYSSERERLAELGWAVGTVFAALDFEEFWDAGGGQSRLRQLPIERFLIDTQDGWVMREARYYRGHIQIEDETAAGRLLLLALLEQREWVMENYLLTRETARAVPHGFDTDRSREIRRLAQVIAERAPGFERWRIEVHTNPSFSTAGRIQEWLTGYVLEAEAQPEVITDAQTLISLLVESYDAAGRHARLVETRTRLQRRVALADVARAVAGLEVLEVGMRLGRLGELLAAMRGLVEGDLRPADKLELLDLMPDLELETRLLTAELLAEPDLRRRDYLLAARALVAASYGTGFLSAGERRALDTQLDRTRQADLTLPVYQEVLGSLTLAMGWGAGTLRHSLAEALSRYVVLEPASAGVMDDVLRGSVLLSLADVLQPLYADVAQLSGVRRSIDGRPAPGLIALNPGYSRGRLRIIGESESVPADVVRTDIVLLTQTSAELPPVAGVLTRGEGNLLSHVQLLARNFGIPNIAMGEREAGQLAVHEGAQIEIIAASDGSVLIRPLVADGTATADPAATAANAATAGRPAGSAERMELTVPLPDLSVRSPLPLADLNRTLSGRVVGPKAANLGELNRTFPGRVAPAIALPFGLFADHVGAGNDSPLAQLAQIYARARAGGLTGSELTDALAGVREQIARVTLSERAKSELLPMMEREFGPPGSYGVFIRSDTNVEDLPGFTGAGLSETVPNVRGLEAQLAVVPRVWGSVLSPRAIAWRSDLLTNPADVFASVLLMKSVPADKSGVLVTTDLAGRGEGLTVSTAWGVGGAVAGEAAETIVLLPGGEERLLSEAKAPLRRYLADAGGVGWARAPSGAVLTPQEKAVLRVLASEVTDAYRPMTDPEGRELPWDIEFGFVSGELTLFQIRPLIERGQRRADRAMLEIAGPSAPVAEVVYLEERPVKSGEEQTP
ncbi:MAG: hypothetical protein KDI31_12420 [Pseudomonadales bacterium]|nr:hypothetical protein [Pseudomonadales bacterium]